MKKMTVLPLAVATLMIVGCSKSPSDKLAARVEASGDARADAMEQNADAMRSKAKALDHRAETARDTAESRADAIKAADMDVSKMTKAQRDAIVANKAPAVH